MAGTQSHPIEYPGHHDASRMTCSQPVKGSNRGCPAYNRCQERTRGKFPVNVFAVDAMGNGVVNNHCEQWYMQLRDMMDGNGRPRFKRIQRPEKLRVKVAEGEVGPGKKITTKMIEVDAPPLELRGETGSGCYSGESSDNLDMLGPDVRRQLGLAEGEQLDVTADDLPIETGTGARGAPMDVNDVLKAAGRDPLPAA